MIMEFYVEKKYKEEKIESRTNYVISGEILTDKEFEKKYSL